MLTLSANNKTYANYSLENFDKFMFMLIKKALKHANINLTVKDYKKAVNESNPDHYENLPIFKRYIQLTLEGKMLFGVQISKIESVTLELC
jgi:hypothetical protein